MTLAELIVPTLKASIAVLVFVIGMGTKPSDLTHLLRNPGQLLRSLVSMNLVMLALAVAIALVFPVQPVVKLLLVALALAPVPPVLPKKLLKVGGGQDYVMALLFTAAIFSIVWIPFAGAALDPIFPAEIHIPPGAVAKVMAMTVIGPTVAGILVRLAIPSLAERIAPALGKIATVLLLIGLVLIVVKSGPAMMELLGDGALLAIIAFLVLGLLAGHLLGGPTPGDRSVLALATASRHPGVALAISQLVFPAEKTILAALLLYLVTGVLVTTPYVNWRRRSQIEAAPPAAAAGG